MLRVIAVATLVAMSACDQGRPREATPPPALAPRPPAPPDAKSSTAHRITYVLQGLGTWKGAVCGCIFRVEIDLDAKTMDTTDPGNVKVHRVLDDRDIVLFRKLGDVAHDEPKTPAGNAADMLEQLDIDDVHIESHGPIARPGAARLVREVFERARFPNQ